MNNLAFKILKSRKFKLRINSELPTFSVINELLLYNNIRFKVFSIDNGTSLEKFEMSFGYGADFFDIYLFAYILKDFGLKTIYFNEELYSTNPTYDEIAIGSNWHRFDNSEHKYVPSRSVEDILSLNPNTPTIEIIKEWFANNSYNQEPDWEPFENYHGEFSKPNINSNTNSEDEFNALTDGSLGDFDDFNGDIDDARAFTGRD